MSLGIKFNLVQDVFRQVVQKFFPFFNISVSLFFNPVNTMLKGFKNQIYILIIFKKGNVLFQDGYESITYLDLGIKILVDYLSC